MIERSISILDLIGGESFGNYPIGEFFPAILSNIILLSFYPSECR